MASDKHLRVLVCGGRDYDNSEEIRKEIHTLAMLDQILAGTKNVVVITGGAKGTDTIAHEWATHYGLHNEVYHADWQTHGKSAGPIRNQKMLDSGIDVVIAFPGGRGTADMVRRAEKAGVVVSHPIRNEVEIGAKKVDW